MSKQIFVTCVLSLFFVVLANAADYSVVVSRQTKEQPGWQSVIDALLERHDRAVVLVWEKDVTEILPVLQKQHPRYTCFVARREEVGPRHGHL